LKKNKKILKRFFFSSSLLKKKQYFSISMKYRLCYGPKGGGKAGKKAKRDRRCKELARFK